MTIVAKWCSDDAVSEHDAIRLSTAGMRFGPLAVRLRKGRLTTSRGGRRSDT